MELTVLIPCLNESETLETCVRKARGFLTSSGVVGEVLVADNGSTDGSQEIARRLGARVVNVTEEGYGAALLGGIAAAEGRYIIMGDADDSYDFARLDPFLEKLRAGAELVVGNRFKGGIESGAMPVLNRYLGNPVLSFLGRLFFRIPINDFHCGLRGFSRDAIQRLDLRTPGMEFASEMIVKAALHGLSITEVPTTLSPDGRSRPPHLKPWRDGWRHLRFLLLHSPRWLFYYPGLALVVFGTILAAVIYSGNVEVVPGVGLGLNSLVTACFAVVTGVQLIAFAVLARRHAMMRKILPPPRRDGFLSTVTLERILFVSLILFLAGTAGFGAALGHWISRGYGPLEFGWVQRLTLVSLTTVTVSIQLAFTGFLASAFNLDET
jgi:hypothetical protein